MCNQEPILNHNRLSFMKSLVFRWSVNDPMPKIDYKSCEVKDASPVVEHGRGMPTKYEDSCNYNSLPLHYRESISSQRRNFESTSQDVSNRSKDANSCSVGCKMWGCHVNAVEYFDLLNITAPYVPQDEPETFPMIQNEMSSLAVLQGNNVDWIGYNKSIEELKCNSPTKDYTYIIPPSHQKEINNVYSKLTETTSNNVRFDSSDRIINIKSEKNIEDVLDSNTSSSTIHPITIKPRAKMAENELVHKSKRVDIPLTSNLKFILKSAVINSDSQFKQHLNCDAINYLVESPKHRPAVRKPATIHSPASRPLSAAEEYKCKTRPLHCYLNNAKGVSRGTTTSPFSSVDHRLANIPERLKVELPPVMLSDPLRTSALQSGALEASAPGASTLLSDASGISSMSSAPGTSAVSSSIPMESPRTLQRVTVATSNSVGGKSTTLPAGAALSSLPPGGTTTKASKVSRISSFKHFLRPIKTRVTPDRASSFSTCDLDNLHQ